MSRPSNHSTEKLQEIINSQNNVIDFVQNVNAPQPMKETSLSVQMGHPAYIESHGVKYVPEPKGLQANIESDASSVSTEDEQSETDDLDSKIDNFLRKKEPHSKTAPADYQQKAQRIMQAQLETERHIARLQGHIEARKQMEVKNSADRVKQMQQKTETMLKELSISTPGQRPDAMVSMASKIAPLKSNLKKQNYKDRLDEDW
jgi:hypothetical protein